MTACRGYWVPGRAPGPPAGSTVRPGDVASDEQASLEFRAQVRSQDAAGAVHEEGHLVADEADVALGVREHGQGGAVRDGHEEEESPVHLDDGLVDGATLEDAGGSC